MKLPKTHMSQLFSPLALRSLTLKNRVVVSPMCQYSSVDGFANDWHFVHLGRFAQGGFSLVIAEATGVTPQGRISYGDLGLWGDAQIAPLKRITDFIHSQGAAAGIQLAHAGRKASARKPWRGAGSTSDVDADDEGYESWVTEAPSAIAHSEAYTVPVALDETGLRRVKAAFVAATQRSEQAGFDVVEVHAAHGYLLNQFLSPLANHRTDGYGGRRDNRMRFPLEVIEAMRAAWPAEKPMFVRISTSDNHAEGWQPADSVVFVGELKRLGIDIIDCSSGGFAESSIKPVAGYQVPFAEVVRREAGIGTMAIGLISEPEAAEAIIANGQADLVALARAALDDPNWPLHAQHRLAHSDEVYGLWPIQEGYAVRNMDRALNRRPVERARAAG